MQTLQQGITLQSGKYIIKKVLGQGGFGITYLAENTMLDGKVAIKEFFFKEYCDRDEATSHVTIGTSSNRELVERFKQKFIKEARTIFKLNHPNIVRILDIFEENGTAYYVMDYIEGESLGDVVKRRGAIPEAEAIGYIKEVASALSYIHGEKINHLDIKPSNIMKRGKDGKILLIDFGVSKQYDAETAEGTTTTPVGISHGYSPTEQYQRHGVQSFSPQSDVYALAATLYKLLTGITPPEAMIVQDEGLPVKELESKGISSSVINSIMAAMLSRSKRTQSIDAFVANLDGDSEDTVVIPMYESEQTHTSKSVPKTELHSNPYYASKPSKSKMIFVVFAIFVLVLVWGVIMLIRNGGVSNESIIDNPIEEIEEPVQEISGSHKGHDWVDLDLPSGTKWATVNIGANSPSDYGNYYAWGETSTKSSYTWTNLKYCLDNIGLKFSKYVTNSNFGKVDGKQELDPNDDAAHVNWGTGWRMPSLEQIKELKEKCKWTWTKIGGHWGYKIVGVNGNSIFLPAAGGWDGSSSSTIGSNGYYWSRTFYANSYANYLFFFSNEINWFHYRRFGFSVRAVYILE